MATILGTTGNDTLNGTAGSDQLSGIDGDDSLSGGDGQDFLQGGTGNDTIVGGDDVDTLDGGSGDDWLTGLAGADFFLPGAGNDTIDGGEVLDRISYSDLNAVSYAAATGPVVVAFGLDGQGTAQDGSGGTDVLVDIQGVTGSSFNDTLGGSSELLLEVFDGGPGDDRIDGGALTDPLSRNTNRVSFSGVTSALTIDLQAGTASGGGIGNDTLLNINFVGGSAFNDTMRGGDPGAMFEQFLPGAGDDSIDGRGGLDVVRYDLTNVSTGAVASLATGVASDGTGGTDTLINIEGLFGSHRADHFTGSNRTDVTEYFMGRGGADTLDGAGGRDVALYSFAPGPVHVQFHADGTATVQDGEATATTDTLIGIEAVFGSAHDDTLSGSDTGRAEVFDGSAGNDTIDGGGGYDDEVSFERAYTHGAVVDLDAGLAHDDGFGDQDTLLGIEHVTGSLLFGDELTGSDSDNRLVGLGGEDSLSGGDGNDTLLGGDDSDDLVPGSGDDFVDGGGGNFDTVLLPNEFVGYQADLLAPGVLRLVRLASNESITLTGVELVSFSDGTHTVTSLAQGLTAPQPTEGPDTLEGTPADDAIVGLGGNDLLMAGGGADDLSGGDGDDDLSGDEGDDSLAGGLGSDTLAGGDGNDLLEAGDPDGGQPDDGPAGADRLDGDDGDDTLRGDRQDTLVGGAGNDRFEVIGFTTVSYEDDPAAVVVVLAQALGQEGIASDGHGGTDRIVGQPISLVGSGFGDSLRGASVVDLAPADAWTNGDNLRGLGGNDTLRGLLGDDTLVGGADDDLLDGGSGYDALFGGDGNDSLMGGDDSDLLSSGTGNDTLVGGDGADTADYSGHGEPVVVHLGNGLATKGTQQDSLLEIENAWGSAFGDRFTGDTGSNRFRGLGGNDTFEASGGIDLLDYDDYTLPPGVGVIVALPSGLIPGTAQDGHGGTDTIHLGAAEQVFASAGPDHITGAEDTTVNTVHHGDDSIWGNDGNDTIDGRSGHDSLLGGPGDDSLVGGEGDDSLQGDVGDDTFVAGDGDDTVHGGDGSDRVVLGFTRAAATVGYSFGDIVITRGDDSVRLQGVEQVQFSDVVLNASALVASIPGTLVASYSFANTLAANEPGRPALVAIDPAAAARFETATVNGQSQTVYSWGGVADPAAQQGGLQLDTSGLVTPNHYSVEIVLRFTATSAPGWRRIVDTHNRVSDIGFYVDSDEVLNVYDEVAGSTRFTTGEFHTVVLTNLVIDGERQVSAYLDGRLELTSQTDQFNLDNADNPDGLLHFFVDNLAGSGRFEWAPGSIASLRLFDGTYVPPPPPAGELVTGTAAGEVLSGGVGNDTLLALDGDDWLVDSAGDDVLDGGAETARFDLDIAVFNGSTPVQVRLADGVATRGDATDQLIDIEAVFGSDGADVIDGRSIADNLRSDTLRGGGGNDTLNGAGGIDTAEFTGPRAGYTITRLSPTLASFTVRDDVPGNGDEGTDALTSIERLVFADQMLAFGTRAEELARVAFVLWSPAIVGSPTLFSRGLSFYDVGYTFEVMSRVALQFWSEIGDAELAQRLVTHSGTSKSVEQLLATMQAAGGGVNGRAAAVREAATDPATTALIEASGILTQGLVASLFVPDFGQLFDLLPPVPGVLPP